MENMGFLMNFSSQKFKCQVPNHQDQKLKHLCMSIDCPKENRLLCDYCIQDHKHSKYFIKIKDLEKNPPERIHNWPISDNKETLNPYFQSYIQDQQQQQNNLFSSNRSNTNSTTNFFSPPKQQSQQQEYEKENYQNLDNISGLKVQCVFDTCTNNNEKNQKQKNPQQQEMFNKVRECFSNYLQQIEEKLKLIEKEIIVQIQHNTSHIEDIDQQINEKIKQIYDPSPLQSLLTKDIDQKPLEKIYDEIDNYLKTTKQPQIEKQCLQLIKKKQEKQHTNSNIIEQIDKVSKTLQDELDKIYEQTKLETTFLTKKNSLVHFNISSFGSSQQSIKVNSNMIQFLPDNNWKIMYTDPFSRNDSVSLRFRMSCIDLEKSYFTIGVVAKNDVERNDNDFAKSGTHFAMSPYLIQSKENNYEGKRFYKIYKEGIELQVDVNISQNLYTIQDRQQTFKISNKAVLESDQEWRIMFSAQGPVAPTFIFF